MRRVPAGWLLVVLSLIAVSCASTTETQVLTADEQFALAMEMYEGGDYRQAIAALQTFTFNYPQDPRIEDAEWLRSRAYFESEDWATAAQEMLNFQREYPRSQLAPEALLQAGRAYEEMSLRPELDQRDTERAVNVFGRVVSEYPRSEAVEEARERRGRLRNKLAEKIFLNAEFYFDNEDWKAAEIYLIDLIQQYTDSDWLPAGYALLSRSYCEQGLADRAAQVYATLAEVYPESDAAVATESELPGECRESAPAGGSPSGGA
jgi:outer membrane assembly lipoprotein YfiO